MASVFCIDRRRPFRTMLTTMSNAPSAHAITAKLLARREAFKSFLVSRVGNAADAEDLLQNGLVKALSRAGELKDEEKAVAWFYQLLRHAIVDHLRSRQASAHRDNQWAADAATLAGDSEAEREICACFDRLLPTLKPAHAELLRRVELRGEPVGEAASALGMTPNHASVALHRARSELRAKLISFCGDCRCLDSCECD